MKDSGDFICITHSVVNLSEVQYSLYWSGTAL